MKEIPYIKYDFNINSIIKPNVKNFSNLFDVKSYVDKEWYDFFDEKFIQSLENILPIDMLMVFTKPSYWSSFEAHIDPGKICALNIVFSMENQNITSTMQWFKVKENKKKSVSYSRANTPYISYLLNELDLIYEECLDNSISLVRVDIPHRIKIGSGKRKCFSFRFKDSFVNWNDALNFFIEKDLNKIFQNF